MTDLLILVPLAAQAAAEAASNGSTQIIVAALGAGSIGAVFAAMVTGLFTKRKLGAEATEIITKAASGVVESLNAEIVRVNATMAAVRKEQADDRVRHAQEQGEERARHAGELAKRNAREAAREAIIGEALRLHVEWDEIVRTALSEHDIAVPKAPPLLSLLRSDD